MMMLSAANKSPETLSEDAKIRQDCWNKALLTFGTAFAFNERARRHIQWLRALSFFNIGIPLAVGVIVLALGANQHLYRWLVPIAGLLVGADVLATLWSIIAEWNQDYAYARQSANRNTRLKHQFERLAKYPPADLAARYQVLLDDDVELEIEDEARDLTPKERRMGMRAALFNYQRECATCKKIPESLDQQTGCGTCG